MNKEFIPYEQAAAFKELGFNEPCFAYYQKSSVIGNNTILPISFRDKTSNFNDYEYSKLGVPFYSAPTFSQAFRWFREKYNILATVYSNASGYLYEWSDNVGGTNRGWSDYEGPNDSGVWDTYEEAELACLNRLIEIVKAK